MNPQTKALVSEIESLQREMNARCERLKAVVEQFGKRGEGKSGTTTPVFHDGKWHDAGPHLQGRTCITM